MDFLEFKFIYDISGFINIYIVFIINATNFSDGIDGLAISEVIKCLLIFLLYNYTSSIKAIALSF